jgi:RND family efflux transporter MFP subunit
VHAQEDEVPLEEGGTEPARIAFLKEQQWQIPFEVEPAREDTIRATVNAPGEIVPPDGALVRVSAPVDGIALAAANRDAPSVGQSVGPGEVLAVLSPSAQEGGFAELRARVERLERDVSRATRLYEAGAIAGKRLEEARHDLEVARAEAEAIGATGDGGDYRLRLAAPFSGVVARRDFVPGGRVRAGEPLFTIVDPSRAWLRVQVPVSAASGLADDARATFVVEGSDDVHETGRVVSVASVLSPETRTVAVVFEVVDLGSPFTFGRLAQVAVPVGGTVTGVVVPNRAIVDDNGTPVVYVQSGGETFERRMLTLGVTDGTRTLVLEGLRSGDRVVTIGPYLVRLASMSGNEFAGGHAH